MNPLVLLRSLFLSDIRVLNNYWRNCHFFPHIHGTPKNPNDIHDALTFYLASPAGESFHLSGATSRICTELVSGVHWLISLCVVLE